MKIASLGEIDRGEGVKRGGMEREGERAGRREREKGGREGEED